LPLSCHGTNPASSVMAGMKLVMIKTTDKDGSIDLKDFHEKAKRYQNELAAIMITYPSTHGIYEETIPEVIDTVHKYGG